MKLTPKQERFCLAYIETGNASEAYRQAYNAERMSANAVRVAACKLLVNSNVTLMIEQQQEAHRAAHSVTVETLNSGIERLISQAQTLSSNGNASPYKLVQGVRTARQDTRPVKPATPARGRQRRT